MRPPLVLSLAALLLTGCAEFPSKGATGDYTRLTFGFTMAAPINPGYVYIVAIRPLRATDTQQDTFGPVPVYGSSNGTNGNGLVAGRPTLYVRYDPTQPEPYAVWKFNPRTPTTDDPSPVDVSNLGYFSHSVISGFNPQITDPTTGAVTYSQRLQFEISTQDLLNAGETKDDIQSIQYNIITTNRVALNVNDLSGRTVDAFGDQSSGASVSFNDYHTAILTSSNTYANSVNSTDATGQPVNGQPNTDLEVAGDEVGTTNPSVDIVDWFLRVQRQG